MEAVEELNDATPPLIDGGVPDDVSVVSILDDSDVVLLDDSTSDVQLLEPDEFIQEPVPVAMDTSRDGCDAVIDHAAADEAAIEVTEAEIDDGSSPDTLPMYEEAGAEDPLTESVEDADKNDAKDSSPDEGESSQPQPEASEEKSTNDFGAFTYPNCPVCGFDRETVFLKEKKCTTGQFRNKIIYRNRCVRRVCNRFFGPTFIWDAKAGVYVKIADESAAANRPFANGPREEKFPAIDYEKAAESGVRPPIDYGNGTYMRPAKVPKTAATAGSGSSTPSTSSTPVHQKVSASSKASSANKNSTIASSSSRAASGGSQKTTTPAVATAKKMRKGYQWVEEEDPPPQPQRHDRVMELARMYAAQNRAEAAVVKEAVSRRTFGTQTGDEEQIMQVLVDEMKAKATFKAMPPTEEVPMSTAMSNRLYLTQKAMKLQTEEMKKLREERDFLKEKVKEFVDMMAEYKKDLVSDATRLKEDVQVANKEIKNFSMEMVNEANKDIRDINKMKEQLAKRIDDSDRYRRKVEASLEYQQSLTAEAENLAANFHRMSMDLDKDISIAKMEKKDAEAKLNDKIYLTNNAKCAHCQVNDRIKNMLTEQIADKTLSNTNLGKERAELAKKLENTERVVAIVSKENKQLKFEKSAWEANCHRFRSELMQLKGGNAGLLLPSSTPSSASIGEAAFTPQSTTTKDAEEVSPERSGDGLIEVDRPQPTSSSSSAEEGEYKSPNNLSPNSLARLPPPPAPPAAAQLKEKEKEKDPSPEHATAFSNWVPKERKSQEMPAEMAEAMRKVAESLERGPPTKKEEKGPPTKKEKREEKAAREGGAGHKRPSGGHHAHPSHPHSKNGEKKPKLDGGARKEEKVPPSRPIPSISSGQKGTPLQQKEKEKERRKEERIRQPSPIPYSSVHEPAYPAVVAKKNAVKVPYNGPSSLVAGSASVSSSSSSHSSPALQKGTFKGTPEKKKPLSFLPVAGSSAMPPLSLTPREPPRATPMDAILREAERLRMIERDREMRSQAQRPDPYRRVAEFDDELPWNQGRPAANYQQPSRPRTPVQDWYYDDRPGHAPPPQPRAPSPRYFDDMYNPRAPRDQFGRLEPDFGVMRHPAHPLPHQLAPPLRGAPPPQGDPNWRRELQDWSNEPPRRGYWD